MNLSGLRRLFPAALDASGYSCLRARTGTATNSQVSGVLVRLQSTDSTSQTDAAVADTDAISENDVVNPNFINRNPRNLEFMGIARRPTGWRFQYPSQYYYHRLVFDQTTRQTQAYVEHFSGKQVITASTQEKAISQFLYSKRDVAACRNVGRVIGQRCLESGVVRMTLLEPEHSESSTKFQAFKSAVQEAGVEFTEPEAVQPHYEPGIEYDNEADLENLKERQRRVETPGQYTAERTRYFQTRKRYKTVY